MAKLTINTAIKSALRTAYPKPPASAARILNKYVSVLEHLINSAMQQPRNAFMRSKNLYYIPITTLQNSGQLGTTNRIRLHKWLETNGYALIEKVETGNNLKGKNSLIKLTKWVTLTDDITENGELKELTDEEIDSYLTGNKKDDAELTKRLYAEFEIDLTDDKIVKETAEKFDFVPVDLQSLRNYIAWLLTESKHIGQTQKEMFVRQAKTILAVSGQLNGIYPQRKIRSEFGRTYYSGISVQNVNKELRRAMLGECWEYDVRSSVVAWKMRFAEEYLQSARLETNLDSHFSATLWLLNEKVEMFKDIQEKTFAGDSNVPADLQIDLIKQAMTAICFGARLQTHGWKTDGGTWENPALVDIIKNAEERKRFIANKDVKDFVKEQNVLDNYIYAGLKNEAPELLQQEFLRTNNRPNKAKAIAYLYQHEEARTMGEAYKYLASRNIEVLAKIHDAFIVREQLKGEDKRDIQVHVQYETANKYWRLGEKQLKRWNEVMSKEEKRRIAEHKKFIADEERHAQEIYKQ